MLKIFKRKILNDWISIAKKLYIECWKSKFNSKLYLTLVIIGKWGHKDTKFRWTKNSGNKQSRGNLILVLCQAQLIRKDVQKLNINVRFVFEYGHFPKFRIMSKIIEINN